MSPTATTTPSPRPTTLAFHPYPATATDTTGATVEGSDDATVENTAPVITASVEPTTARVGDTLTCSATAPMPMAVVPSPIPARWPTKPPTP